MTEILSALVSHTLGGTIAICAMALLTWAGRNRTGARWRSLAWLVLCLRLAVPLPLLPVLGQRIPSPIRIPVPDALMVPEISASSGPSSVSPGPEDPGTGGSSPVSPAGPSGGPSGTGRPETPRVPAQKSPELRGTSFPVWLPGVIWLAGAGAELGRMAFVHLRFLAWLRRWGIPAEDPDLLRTCDGAERELGLLRGPRVLLCPGLPSPMLAGILRPALLLPEKPAGGYSLRYVLLHELTHYRRRDLLRKALVLWVRALHWFNPAFWCMAKMAERDMELACDEAVLARLSREECRAYGRTILEAAECNLQTPV